MNFIFCKLKNLKKHEFHFLQTSKTSKNMNVIFFLAALAKMTPKRIEVDTKNFTHVAKTVSPLPKLLPLHVHVLLIQQKPHKKKIPASAAILDRQT